MTLEFNDRDWLHQKYIVERLSCKRVARLINVSDSTIRRALIRHNISIRAPIVAWHKTGEDKRDWLYQKYVVEELSCLRIALLINVHPTTIHNALVDLNIPRRGFAGDWDRTKENNGHWKGGISKHPEYFRQSPEYQEWMKAVMERDKGMCQIDILLPEEFREPHEGDSAHHIYPVRDVWEMRFDVSNGLCLCRACHNKLHKRWGGYNSVPMDRKVTLYKDLMAVKFVSKRSVSVPEKE